MQQLDIIIFHFFNNFAGVNTWLDGLFLFFASYLDIVLIVIAGLFLLLHDDFPKLKYFSKTELIHRVRDILLAFVSSGFAWVVANIIKDTFSRPRPFLGLSEVNLLVSHGAYDSFPSGHATFFIALALALYFRHKTIGIFFGVCALLIGISRIIIGIHYPSDILFGFILGAVIAMLIEFFVMRPEKKKCK